ncbi:MAG TPA: type IV secretion protein [Microvirga sp.]|jgi:type IV secretion system protein VirB1|nr:type IV secretion protein [Microvirga sp.]
MDAPALLALVERCAPGGVPREPLVAIVREASGGEPFLISFGGERRGPVKVLASSREEAVELTTEAIVAGEPRVAIGLAQLDTSQLQRMGLSVTQAFEPCRHVKATGQLFNERFEAALRHGRDRNVALAGVTASFRTARTEELPRTRPPRLTELQQPPVAPASQRGSGRGPPDPPHWDVYRSSIGATVLIYGATVPRR